MCKVGRTVTCPVKCGTVVPPVDSFSFDDTNDDDDDECQARTKEWGILIGLVGWQQLADEDANREDRELNKKRKSMLEIRHHLLEPPSLSLSMKEVGPRDGPL